MLGARQRAAMSEFRMARCEVHLEDVIVCIEILQWVLLALVLHRSTVRFPGTNVFFARRGHTADITHEEREREVTQI